MIERLCPGSWRRDRDGPVPLVIGRLICATMTVSTLEQPASFSYTSTYNLTGWSAAVVRVGTTAGGLPIGVQVVARPWREDVALKVAQFLEQEFGGWIRPPI